MNSRFSDHDEARLLQLLTVVQQTGDNAARTELNKWLRDEPAARASAARLLVDERALVSTLRDDDLLSLLETGTLPQPPPAHFSSQPAPVPVVLRPLAVAAVLAAALFVAWFKFSPSAGPNADILPVAVLESQAEAAWDGTALTPGRALIPGVFSLKSGMAAIEFNNGARLLIEGPARFEIDSADRVFFNYGRLRANVPPTAQGFTVGTPKMEVVDIGTSFGLAVQPDGRGVVRVLKGEIKVHGSREQRSLFVGESVSVGPDGHWVPKPGEEAVFPSEDELRSRLTSVDQKREEKWRESLRLMEQDPDMLVTFDFQQEAGNPRRLRNLAEGATERSHAALVGADWGQGRWKGKQAVEFRGPGDRMRFQLLGKYAALTLMAWVRVDSLPNDYNGLILPSGLGPGSVQWMLESHGNLRFNMPSDGFHRWEGPVSAKVIRDLDFGRWLFLATTYDANTGKVVHYRDGKKVGEGKFKRSFPAVLGSMGIGNRANSYSAGADSPKDFRNFVGAMDEFCILSRVLSPAEIEAHYLDGRP